MKNVIKWERDGFRFINVNGVIYVKVDDVSRKLEDIEKKFKNKEK